MTRVKVLAGGPDAEHDVSVASANAIARALETTNRFRVDLQVFREPSEIVLDGVDVVVPALHGPWGEGGGAQRLLEESGIAFVGSGSEPASVAMDKLLTKRLAAESGVATPEAVELDRDDATPELAYPFIVKPVAEGSSVGLYTVRDEASWNLARAAIDRDQTPGRRWMAEAFVGVSGGRELTVPLLDRGAGLVALETIEIVAASGVYDFAAKYERGDTRYVLSPELPAGVGEAVARAAVGLAAAIGVRHLARVDFRLDESGSPWMLEVNTFPGFTAASLLPKAALSAGLDLPALCGLLVDRAIADHSPARAP